MNLEKFKTDTKLFSYLLIVLAAFFGFMFLFIFGFAIIFFIIIIGWIILVFYYLKFLVEYNFTARIVAIFIAIMITLGIFFWAYNSPVFNKSDVGKITKVEITKLYKSIIIAKYNI